MTATTTITSRCEHRHPSGGPRCRLPAGHDGDHLPEFPYRMVYACGDCGLRHDERPEYDVCTGCGGPTSGRVVPTDARRDAAEGSTP